MCMGMFNLINVMSFVIITQFCVPFNMLWCVFLCLCSVISEYDDY